MADTPEDKAPKPRVRKAKADGAPTSRKRTPAKSDEPTPVEAAVSPAPRRRAKATSDKAAASAPPSTTARKAKTSANAKAAAKSTSKPASRAKPASPAKAKSPKAAKPRLTAKLKSEVLPPDPIAQRDADAAAKALPPAGVAPPPPEPAPPVTAPLVQAVADDVEIHPVAAHAPSVHKHDEGLEIGLSPVDLPPDARVREEGGFGWFTRILVYTSPLLILFNSFAIDKWAREQPVTPRNSQLLIAAQQLHAGMKGLHLDAPLEGMRSVWHGIRAAQWPGSEGNLPKAEAERAPTK